MTIDVWCSCRLRSQLAGGRAQEQFEFDVQESSRHFAGGEHGIFTLIVKGAAEESSPVDALTNYRLTRVSR